MKGIKNYFKNVSLLYGHIIVWLWTGDKKPMNDYINYIKANGLVELV